MKIVKDFLVGATIVLPILFGGYGLFIWVGPNSIILVLLAVCVLFLCASVGNLIRNRPKATS